MVATQLQGKLGCGLPRIQEGVIDQVSTGHIPVTGEAQDAACLACSGEAQT